MIIDLTKINKKSPTSISGGMTCLYAICLWIYCQLLLWCNSLIFEIPICL